jgi:hypothetical protein
VSTRYDQVGRPIEVLVDNDLTTTPDRYTMSYDEPGATRFALGRMWRTTDPLGNVETIYDKRGFVLESKRAFTTPHATLNSIKPALFAARVRIACPSFVDVDEVVLGSA